MVTMVISDVITTDLLIVRVDEVSTTVIVSALVEAGKVLNPAPGIVHSHLGGRKLTPCQYYNLL